MLSRLLYEPLILGNVLRAVLGLGALAGLSLTDAGIEAVITAVLAVLAAYAVITKKEREVVTPVAKVATILDQPVRAVDQLLRNVGQGGPK